MRFGKVRSKNQADVVDSVKELNEYLVALQKHAVRLLEVTWLRNT